MFMAIEEITTAIPPELISNLHTLSVFLQAIGAFIIFYIIFNIVDAIINRKKTSELKKINHNLEEIKQLLIKWNKNKKMK